MNQESKAVSFDFWDTLVYSNPQYKLKQFNLLREFDIFLTKEEWMELNKKTKLLSNEEAEKNGSHLDRRILYNHMFPNWSQLMISEFINYSNEIFLLNPPIIKGNSRELIQELKNLNYKIYLSSNTVFTHGDILSKVIFQLFGITKHNCLFSDEIGYSKPHPSMFNFSVKPTHHIGDNPLTDGKCTELGIDYIKVDSDSPLDLNIINIIRSFKYDK